LTPFIPQLGLLILIVVTFIGIQASVVEKDTATHNVLLAAVFMNIIGVVMQTATIYYKGAAKVLGPDGVPTWSMVMMGIGMLAVLISSMMDFWYAQRTDAPDTQRELYVAGSLALLGMVLMPFYYPLGVLVVTVALVINLIIGLHSTDKTEHDTLIAAAILLVVGMVISSIAFYSVRQKIEKASPETLGNTFGASKLGLLGTRAAYDEGRFSLAQRRRPNDPGIELLELD